MDDPISRIEAPTRVGKHGVLRTMTFISRACCYKILNTRSIG